MPWGKHAPLETGLLAEALRKCENDLIEQALMMYDRDIEEAARYLGISRRTLYYKMGRHGFLIDGKKFQNE